MNRRNLLRMMLGAPLAVVAVAIPTQPATRRSGYWGGPTGPLYLGHQNDLGRLTMLSGPFAGAIFEITKIEGTLIELCAVASESGR